MFNKINILIIISKNRISINIQILLKDIILKMDSKTIRIMNKYLLIIFRIKEKKMIQKWIKELIKNKIDLINVVIKKLQKIILQRILKL